MLRSTGPDLRATVVRRPRGPSRRAVAAVLGAAVLLGTWSWAARGMAPIVLPGPSATGEALWALVRSGELAEQLGRTLVRIAVGGLLGVGIGIALGVAAGLSSVVDGLLQPVRVLLAGLPPVVTVVIAMIWLGPSGTVAVIAVVAAMLPQVLLTSREAVRAVDRDLLEMARSFDVGLGWTLRQVIVPAMAPPVLAAVAVTLSNALRLTMMAELLAAPDGTGASVAAARTYLDTPTVFAWALVAVGFALAVDWLLLGPVRRRALGWAS